MNSLYVSLIEIDPKYLFLYIVIIIISILFFRHNNFKIISMIGLIFGIIISYIIYDKNKFKNTSKKEDLRLKQNKLIPQPKYSAKYSEVTEFLYSIREFYQYNRPVFTDLVNSLDSFMILYDDINIGVQRCKDNFDILKDKKYEALNNLHAIIFNLENSEVLIQKIKDAMKFLHKLLNKYYFKAIKICNNQEEYDVNTTSRFINKYEPEPYNTFLDINKDNLNGYSTYNVI
jgi:hypothetical protein